MESIAWNLMIADGIDQLFVQAALVYGMLRLLPMKHKGLFCTITLLVPTLVNTLFYYVWSIGLAPGMIILVLVAFVLPFVLYEGSKGIRLVAVLASQLCAAVGETLFYTAYELLGSYPLPTGDDYASVFVADIPMWLLLELLRAILVMGALLVVANLLRGKAGRPAKRVWLYPALMIGQTVLLVIPFAIAGIFHMPMYWHGLCAVIAALFLIGDLLLLEVSDRCAKKDQQDEALRRISERIAALEKEGAANEGRIESLAHLRHDMRNELAVAASLADKGDHVGARAMLDELETKLASSGRAGRAGQAELEVQVAE